MPNLRDVHNGEVKVVRAFLVGLVECGGREGVPTPRRTRPVTLGCSKNLHDERRCPAAIETERGRAELHLHQIAIVQNLQEACRVHVQRRPSNFLCVRDGKYLRWVVFTP